MATTGRTYTDFWTTAQNTDLLAQEGVVRTWIDNWTNWLSGTLRVVFVTVVILVGILTLVRKANPEKRVLGGVRGAIGFALGAALVYLLLTHVVDLADLMRSELPLDKN